MAFSKIKADATELDVATQAELDALVDAAPGALNTLNELAAALGDDSNYATSVTNSLAAKSPLAAPVFTTSIKVTGQSATPTGSAGMMYYDSDTNLMYLHNGTGWEAVTVGAFMAATGPSAAAGTTVDTDYKYHVFNADGTFVVSVAGTVEYLVIGGGGGGGITGGGGGAGAYWAGTELAMSVGSYAITVGDGGAGSTTNATSGVVGGDSSIGSLIVASGGGGGGGYDSTGTITMDGGSGGGAGGRDTHTQPVGTAIGQSDGVRHGNDGGTNWDGGTSRGAGGGGGAGTAAPNQNSTGTTGGTTSGGGSSGTGGKGGAGLSSSITGSSVDYAGGGGGAGTSTGGAATHGGSAGVNGAGTPAVPTANRGGGGGGGWSPGGAGGVGGSGVVIIRYKFQ